MKEKVKRKNWTIRPQPHGQAFSPGKCISVGEGQEERAGDQEEAKLWTNAESDLTQLLQLQKSIVLPMMHC